MIEKLGDIASYVNGFAFKPSEWAEEGLPIIRIQDLTGTSSNPNYYNKPYDKKYEINKGDVLISWSASLGVYIWCGEKALLNQHIFKVIFDKKDINKDFFVYQVSHILKKASEQAHGATMRHLTRPVFNSLPFWLPERNIQNKIADTLNLLSKLIVAKEKQVKELDKLIKSRFVEMFGDPISNSKKWHLLELGAITSVGSSRRIFENEYVPEGVPFYRTKEIVELSKGQSITTELYISKKRYDEIKNKYGVPQVGDLLISAVGTLGVIWIVDGRHEFYYKDGNLIKVDASDKFDSIFMKALLENVIDEYRKRIASGTAYAALTISGLEKMKIYDIPITLQKLFSNFYCRVDKSKLSTENSRKMIQNVIKYREK